MSNQMPNVFLINNKCELIKSMHIFPCDRHLLVLFLSDVQIYSKLETGSQLLTLGTSLFLSPSPSISIYISISTRQCLRITHFSLMFNKMNATPRMCIGHTIILEHTGWKDTNVSICYQQLTPFLVVIKRCVCNL